MADQAWGFPAFLFICYSFFVILCVSLLKKLLHFNGQQFARSPCPWHRFPSWRCQCCFSSCWSLIRLLIPSLICLFYDCLLSDRTRGLVLEDIRPLSRWHDRSVLQPRHTKKTGIGGNKGRLLSPHILVFQPNSCTWTPCKDCRKAVRGKTPLYLQWW